MTVLDFGHRPQVGIGWTTREPPLEPVAVVGQGVAARTLARRILEDERPGVCDLRVAVGDDWIVVCGPADVLPWADGATYLGLESTLLTPTTMRTTLPVDLVERAIGRKNPGTTVPFRVLIPDCLLVSALPTREVNRGRLRRFSEGDDGA